MSYYCWLRYIVLSVCLSSDTLWLFQKKLLQTCLDKIQNVKVYLLTKYLELILSLWIFWNSWLFNHENNVPPSGYCCNNGLIATRGTHTVLFSLKCNITHIVIIMIIVRVQCFDDPTYYAHFFSVELEHSEPGLRSHSHAPIRLI